MNLFLNLQAFIISIIASILISYLLNIKELLLQAIIAIIIYVVMSNILTSINEKEISSCAVTKHVKETGIMERELIKKYPDLYKINENNEDYKYNSDVAIENSGPLDNLEPQELKSRLNYLYYATAHPYKQMSYQEYKTHDDIVIDSQQNDYMKAPNSLKHLEYSKIHYPQLTENQVNYNDCTNHGYGELSCNQSTSSTNLHYPFDAQSSGSILVDGISSEKDLKNIIREDFY